MVMVSSIRMSVKSQCTSRLPLHELLSFSTITLTNKKEPLIVNSLIITQWSMGTKNFAILCVSVPIADSICVKGGETYKVTL